MKSDHFLYFAYGSNMLSDRLTARTRCPSAKSVGAARLDHHQLRWHKRSTDGSGKCNIVQSDAADAFVWGVLFEIPNDEKAALDEAEGVGSGYKEAKVTVTFDGNDLSAVVYVATAIDETLKPYSWYRAFALAGARQHKLPQGYVDSIHAVEAQHDQDKARHKRNMAIIPEAFQ